jgi:hypothetical protein
MILPDSFTINYRNCKDRLCSLYIYIYKHLHGTYCLHFPTVKMEGAGSFETLINIYQVTRHRILDDKNFHTSLVFILLKAKMFYTLSKIHVVHWHKIETQIYIFRLRHVSLYFRQKRLPYNLLLGSLSFRQCGSWGCSFESSSH